MHRFVRFSFILLISAGFNLGDRATLVYKIDESGAYSFAAATNFDFNLTNGDTFLQSDKMMYSTSDGSLKLGSSAKISGNDVLGSYQGMLFNYNAGNDAHMQDHLMVYNGGEFVRFTQVRYFNTNYEGYIHLNIK
ncbi:uncharacterized protein LOC144424420 [Styela clava]